jgi:outer membrane protein assembly factor BamB
VVRVGGRAEIVVVGGDAVTGHDPATGRELWRAGGLNPDNNPYYRIVASPVVVGDIVIASTRVKPMTAFRAGGSGDVTTSRRLWSYDTGPDVPTPATDGTLLYVLGDKGLLTAIEVATGRVVYDRQRLRPGTYSASPVLADGRLYIVSEDGVVSVVKAGPSFVLEAENTLDEYTLSSPAISGGLIFLKTERHLWAVGEPR